MSNAKQFGPGAVNAPKGVNGSSAALATAVRAGVASIGAAGTRTATGTPPTGTGANAASTEAAGAATASPSTGAVVGDLGVSVTQERAIAALAMGRNATEAAAEAGVTRATLHRWLREDAAFIAAYNRWRRDVTQSARGRMMALTSDAVDSLASAVRGGDGRLALQLLKSLGVAAAEPEGPLDPEGVRREQKLKWMKEKSEFRREEVYGGFNRPGYGEDEGG